MNIFGCTEYEEFSIIQSLYWKTLVKFSIFWEVPFDSLQLYDAVNSPANLLAHDKHKPWAYTSIVQDKDKEKNIQFTNAQRVILKSAFHFNFLWKTKKNVHLFWSRFHVLICHKHAIIFTAVARFRRVFGWNDNWYTVY